MHLLATASALVLTLVGIGASPTTQVVTQDQSALTARVQEPEKGKPQEPDKKKAGKAAKDAGSKKDKDAAAEWITDYKAALTAAKKGKKVVLMDFTGSDWCGWCKKLKAEVFDQPEFQQWAAKNAILLEVDFPKHKELPKELQEQNKKLGKEFDIKGYPTIILVDAKGKKIGQLGYMEGGPEKWTKEADKLIKKKK